MIARNATADASGPNMHVDKIGDVPLFTIVGTLASAWLLSVVGLSFTIKREHLHSFVSLQTGCSFIQSHFHDNQGHDARRVEIFFKNLRKWRAIRDLVRQWVLSVYATWQAMMPAWFTPDLQARMPDDFMPAQVVHDLHAQAPNGRRPTLQNMGLVRRVSLSSESLPMTPRTRMGGAHAAVDLHIGTASGEHVSAAVPPD